MVEARGPLSSLRGARLRQFLVRQLPTFVAINGTLSVIVWDEDTGGMIPVNAVQADAFGTGPGCKWLKRDVLRRRLGCSVYGKDHGELRGMDLPSCLLFEPLTSPLAQQGIFDFSVIFSWERWLIGHCRLAYTWLGDGLTDEPTILSEHTMRQWHGLVRLRHRVILAMTEQMLRDRRAFHTLYSPLSSTCRRHRASWKDCWSKLAAAVSQLTNLHMLNPQCDWLAFNLDQDQREVYSKHWDFAPAFLIKPEIDRGSVDTLAGDLQKLIKDFRFDDKEKAGDLIRDQLDQGVCELVLGPARR